MQYIVISYLGGNSVISWTAVVHCCCSHMNLFCCHELRSIHTHHTHMHTRILTHTHTHTHTHGDTHTHTPHTQRAPLCPSQLDSAPSDQHLSPAHLGPSSEQWRERWPGVPTLLPEGRCPKQCDSVWSSQCHCGSDHRPQAIRTVCGDGEWWEWSVSPGHWCLWEDCQCNHHHWGGRWVYRFSNA